MITMGTMITIFGQPLSLPQHLLQVLQSQPLLLHLRSTQQYPQSQLHHHLLHWDLNVKEAIHKYVDVPVPIKLTIVEQLARRKVVWSV